MKKILFIALVFIGFQSFGQADKILTRNGTTIDTATTLESQARAVNRAALKLNISDTASMLAPYKNFVAANNLVNTQFDWAVIDSVNSPALFTDSLVGNKYLVGTAATGLWTGQGNKIATYDSAAHYSFQSATIGDLLLNSKLSFVLQWDGTTWKRIDKAKLHAGGDSYGIPISVGTNDAQVFTVKQANIPSISLGTSGINRYTTLYGDRIQIGPYQTGSGVNLRVHGVGNFGDLWDFTWQHDYNSVMNFGSYTGYADLRINGNNKIRLLSSSVNIGYQPTVGKGSLSIAATSGTTINSLPPLHFVIPANLLDSARQGSIEVKGNDIYYTWNDTTRKLIFRTPISTSSELTVVSTTKGSIPFPLMTSAQRFALAVLTVGLHVYQTDATEGVYVYKSTGWQFAY